MPLARFKLAIPAIERLQTYAVYRTAMIIFHKLGCTTSYTLYLIISPHTSDARASFWARSKRNVTEVWQLALPRLSTCKPNTSEIQQFARTFTEAEACFGNEDQKLNTRSTSNILLLNFANGNEFDRIGALVEHFLSCNEMNRRQKGHEDKEEDVSSYWKTWRKWEDTGNWKRKH